MARKHEGGAEAGRREGCEDRRSDVVTRYGESVAESEKMLKDMGDVPGEI